MRRCMRTASLFAGLVGCFAPTAPTGATCAPASALERCPAGQQCIAHDGVETCELPGAFPDAGTRLDADATAVDGDGDQDGVLDSVDNCREVANANQSDEDGDEQGDVCDVCPPYADNNDGDGDGLGDACDPNPGTPGDELFVFDSFAGGLAAPWASSGAVMASNGNAVMIAGDLATSVLTRASPTAGRVEIRAALVVDAITASGNNLGSISLIERRQPNTDQSVACQLAGLADGTQESLRIFDASAAAVITDTPHGFAMGTETELRLNRNGTSYTCRVTSPAAQVTGVVGFSPASPHIGMRVRGAAARFHWVLVTTSP